MKIRAMMRVTARQESVELHQDTSVPTSIAVKLQPIFNVEGANASWSKWTPSGQLELTITNPNVYDSIKVGGTFSVTLAEVDPKTLEQLEQE